ncbi:MAG: hypothetical protein J5543_09550 [Bacteroidales bacterium]|nr:hypothetical protein [Bacteroidales bacterium]
MTQFKYIVKFLIALITQSEQAWNYLATAETKESKPDYMLWNYYYPLLGFMSLVIFICAGSRGPNPELSFDFQHGMTQMVPILVAYFVGPYMAMILIKQTLVNLFDLPNPDKDRLTNFVFYSTSFLMALEMLMAAFPAFRFFQFIALYLVYITWNGSHTYIRVEEKRRWLFGFVSFLVIFFSPSIIQHLLQFLQG